MVSASATFSFYSILVCATGASSCNSESCLGDDREAQRSVAQKARALLQSKPLAGESMHQPLAMTAGNSNLTVESQNVSNGFVTSDLLKEASNMTQDVTCIERTGGTCMLSNCANFRGPTQCYAGSCFCKTGYCSTVQGECVQQKNRKIASKIILRNARYPSYVMYMATYNSDLWISKQTMNESAFNLFELPGEEGFLLGSEKYGTWVAAFDERVECDDRSTSGSGRGIASSGTTCTDRIEASAVPIHQFVTNAAEKLAVNLLAAPEYEGEPAGVQSVMIESYKYPRRFMTVTSASWDVSAGYNDRGAGCYWLIEPPLKIKLKPYKGPRCSFNCGSYGSHSLKCACCHCMCLLLCIGCWLANSLPA